MSETKAVANIILEERAKLKRDYDNAIAALDAVELAAARAEQLAVAWKNSAEGRDTRVWLSTGSFTMLTLVLVLNRGDEFGLAADHFAYSTEQLSSAFPEGWEVKVADEVADATYDPKTAARSLSIDARPKGGSYMQSIHVSVRVELPVGEGDACRVIKVGERPAYSPAYYSGPSPIYKALCPGDALPLGGA